MKSDPNFPKLPSVSELLQHPAVEKVVERVNQSTIAQRATGFLTELQTGWREASEDATMPSLSQIAERLAQRLMGRSDHMTPAINATGVICSTRWQMPMADCAVQEQLRLAGEFFERTGLQEQACALLCDLTGAESAWVVHSYQFATRLVQETTADLAEYAGLVDPKEYGHLPVCTLSSRLQAGANLIVCDGAGLLGGPGCGILLGHQKQVEALRHHAWADSAAADALQLVALIATLAVYRRPDQVAHQIPVWQLLSTPQDNLKQRCHRMATLIAEGPSVSEAVPISTQSTWFASDSMQLAGTAWAIQLKPANLTIEHFVRNLEKTLPRVVVRVEDDVVWIDLRSVFPRWDQPLIEAFLNA